MDGSALSWQIVGHVQQLFSPADCELILLRVTESPEGRVANPPLPISDAWRTPLYTSYRDVELSQHPTYASQVWENVRATAESELLPEIQALKEAGYVMSVLIESGDPAQTIVDVAERHAVDMVAMATHGRTGLRRLVLGSVAEAVLRELAVPAELRPEKIKTLVYLAAYLIPNGEAMLPTALSDTESLIVSNLVVNQAQGYHMLKQEAFKAALYADCSDEDVALATVLLTPEPNGPVATPLKLSDENFGRVMRVYIETLQDKGLTPTLQKKMYTAVPCQKIVSMETSHSPFLSAPEKLVSHLTAL